MGEVIKVGMADLNICKAPDTITTLGLGSCIGIALLDPVTKIMLPDSTKMKNNSNIAKFADTGIVELVRRMTEAGAAKSRLVAKIAGGARMFEVSGNSEVGNIGARNAEASRQKLKELGIPLLAEDTGLNYGRTVELHCDTGEFYIKSVGKDEDKTDSCNRNVDRRIYYLYCGNFSENGIACLYKDIIAGTDYILSAWGHCSLYLGKEF